jgi:hypothetical protein
MEKDSPCENATKFNIKKYHPFFWILVPIIGIGGMFYPLLGLLLLPMMVILLVLSYFKARYWCNNICARSSYMNNVISKVSLFRRVPTFFHSMKFKYGFLIVFFALFFFRIYSVLTVFQGWILLEKIGFVFASVCLVGALASSVLGIAFVPRTWCSFCPMVTLQAEIFKRGKGKKE